MIGVSVFEWGAEKLRWRSENYAVSAPPGAASGVAGGEAGFSTYYLVAPWKFGLDAKSHRGLRRQGGRAQRHADLPRQSNHGGDEAGMDRGFHERPAARTGDAPYQKSRAADAHWRNRGQQMLSRRDESRNGAILTPHRACAIRCISGGVPPVRVARAAEDGPAIYLLLVSAEGKPVNQQVLNLVAEPVEDYGRG